MRTPHHVSGTLAECCKEFYYQEEKGAGESGYLHYQGCFALSTKNRLGPLKNLLGWHDVHLEPCREWQAAKAYSTKADTRVKGPWSHKAPPLNPKYQLSLLLMRPWQLRVRSWLMREPDNRHITWVCDEIGGNGKTALALHMVDEHGAARYNSGAASDIAYAYNHEKIVIFDFQRAKEHINYSTMEDLKNGHLFSGKYESRAKRFNPPHVVVLANKWPEFGNMSLDRWVLFKLTGGVLTRMQCMKIDGDEYTVEEAPECEQYSDSE